MNWIADHLNLILTFGGIWVLANGIIHDIFVLRQHRKYDRQLVSLLVDGHVLIFGGIIYLLSIKGIVQGDHYTLWYVLANSLFLLSYCAIIFRLIPAIGMIGINLIIFVAALIALLQT